jgi:exonuclease SbcD
MRLLHTSDWHLGRSLHGYSLLEAQREFVDFLLEVVATEEVDVVLLAGDIYDRAIPATEAVALLNEVLTQLSAAGTPLVAITGNHDSPARVGFGSELMRAAGIHMYSSIETLAAPTMLSDLHGPVAIYGLPFLEPAMVWRSLEAQRCDHQSVLEAAMSQIRAHLCGLQPGTRSVVLSHAFVVGVGDQDGSDAEVSESERDISVGGSAMVSAALFEGVDYVALGHLHGAQQPRNGRVVYSGSPLAYSFSEEHHTKSVTIVDLEQDGTVAIRQVPTPVHRPVIRLSGELEEFLNEPSLLAHRSDLCSIHLTDSETPIEPMARLRQSYDHVLELSLESRLGHQHDLSYAKRLAGLSDLELSEQFIADMWGRPALPTETKLLQAGLESLRSGQESSVTGNERSINIDEGQHS